MLLVTFDDLRATASHCWLVLEQTTELSSVPTADLDSEALTSSLTAAAAAAVCILEPRDGGIFLLGTDRPALLLP